MTGWLKMLAAYRALRAFDKRRPGVPGEHWATFGAAIGAISAAGRARSPLLRTLALVAGGALVLRAISGRDGAGSVLSRKLRERR